MYKSHFERVFKDNRKKILALALLLLPSFDVFLLLLTEIVWGVDLNPYYSMFLDLNNEFYFLHQIYFWFLPLYFTLLIGDDGIEDFALSYKNVLVSKVGRKRYICEKLVSSFIVTFLIIFVSLMLNYILVFIVMRGGDWWLTAGIELPWNKLFTVSVKHPVITNIVYSLITAFIGGLSTCSGCSLCMVFKSKKYAYPSIFLVWYILSHIEYPITMLFQPFTEYDFNVLVQPFIISLTAFLTIIVFGYVYGVKYEKI